MWSVNLSCHRYGVAVHDFGKSWTSGLAFLAVIKSIDPSLVDMRKAMLRSPRENMEDAFRIAHYSLGIPRLLDSEGNNKIACFLTVSQEGYASLQDIRFWHIPMHSLFQKQHQGWLIVLRNYFM